MFMTFGLCRAFVLKQLISVLKRWRGRLIWRRRNIIPPTTTTSNVPTGVTGSTAATSSEVTTALAKRSSRPLGPGGGGVTKVESAPPIESAGISSGSTSAHVETGATFGADFGVRSKDRFSTYAGVNAHKSQLHSHFIELDGCLTKVAE